jgi:hypothetical protein
MALTAAQIISLACQTAKCPGFTAQAGALLNTLLQDLAQDYDLDINRVTVPIALTGSFGPYALPADFLRVEQGDAGPGVLYRIDGTPRRLTAVDKSEFDGLPQTAGVNGFPSVYAVDASSVDDLGYAQLYVWPAAAATTLYVTYFKGHADIVTPESSSAVPWFPNTNYLQTRLAGELMRLTDDMRMAQYLGDGPEGAQGILNRYLKLADDKETRQNAVQLDRRRFGGGGARLRTTKTTGW